MIINQNNIVKQVKSKTSQISHHNLSINCINYMKYISLIIQKLKFNCQMNQTHSCCHCNNIYSRDNPPKNLINCPHILCSKCLESQLLVCPVDKKRIEKRKYKLQSFQTNETILNDIERMEMMQIQKEQSSKISVKLNSKSNSSKSTNKITTPYQRKQRQPQISLFTAHQASTKNISNSKILNEKPKRDESKLENSPKKSLINFDSCLLHSNIANLICMNDKCLICSSCGLFGEHKSHTLMTYENFLKEYSDMSSESLKIFQILQQREGSLNKQLIMNKIDEIIKQKKDKEVKSIRLNCRSMIDLIQKYQKQLIANLNIALDYKKTKINEALKIDDLISKKQQFFMSMEKISNGVQDLLNLENIEEYITYIDKNHQNSFIQEQGQYLIVEIDDFLRKIEPKIENQINQLSFQFNIQQGSIRDMVKLITKDGKSINSLIEQNNKKNQKIPKIGQTPNRSKQIVKPQNMKTSPIQNKQDALLIGTNSKSGSKNSSTKYEIKSPAENKSNSINRKLGEQFIEISSQIPQQSKQVSIFSIHDTQKQNGHHKTKSQANTPFISKQFKRNAESRKQNELSSSRAHKSKPKSNQKLSQNVDKECPTPLLEKNDNRRKKKIDMPEKYMKLYDDLLKDKVEILDFGGAFLGNNNILSISELFHSSLKLKQIKLMNNKITDDIFPELLSKCTNVFSLNLSFNSLTEKSLEWLQVYAQQLGELKNITLSNNKIVLRNVRDRLQDLARKGLKVSL